MQKILENEVITGFILIKLQDFKRNIKISLGFVLFTCNTRTNHNYKINKLLKRLKIFKGIMIIKSIHYNKISFILTEYDKKEHKFLLKNRTFSPQFSARKDTKSTLQIKSSATFSTKSQNTNYLPSLDEISLTYYDIYSLFLINCFRQKGNP